MNITHKGISGQELWLPSSLDGVSDSCVVKMKCSVAPQPAFADQLCQTCSDITLLDGKLQLQKSGIMRGAKLVHEYLG